MGESLCNRNQGGIPCVSTTLSPLLPTTAPLRSRASVRPTPAVSRGTCTMRLPESAQKISILSRTPTRKAAPSPRGGRQGNGKGQHLFRKRLFPVQKRPALLLRMWEFHSGRETGKSVKRRSHSQRETKFKDRCRVHPRQACSELETHGHLNAPWWPHRSDVAEVGRGFHLVN